MTEASIEVQVAGPAAAASLAALHATSLPASLLSALGVPALERFYRFVMQSPSERVWIAREGGSVIGGCVLSHAPDTLLRRFAVHAPVSLARELGRELVTDPALRRRFMQRLRERTAGDPVGTPEVTQIFTDARHRGRGIGARLLRTCEDHLRTEGESAYAIHTHRDDNTAGIRFYEREGFAIIGESQSFGDAFVVMRKPIS